MNNLSTQIATTREQSERLLAMGVNPETADMSWKEIPTAESFANGTEWTDESDYEWILLTDNLSEAEHPAWSLSRLISMLPPFISGMKFGHEPHHPELIKSKQGYVLSIRRRTADCLVGTHIKKDPIECCVSMIDWLIKNNHFNKKYLK